MEIIKEYPLGQLFGKPNDNIDFALLTSDELLKLITDEKMRMFINTINMTSM
ncbi:hypothetical protein [Chryseobacterium wanjuense]